MSRKTKKAAKQYFDSFEHDQMLSEEELKWMSLPDCKWCGGIGTNREDFYDTGYGCTDCYATGKTGWRFNDKGEKRIK
jgi:hypothetical protein